MGKDEGDSAGGTTGVASESRSIMGSYQNRFLQGRYPGKWTL